MNIGEEICGEWLRHVKKCEFIQYNVKTSQVQGEIDVIGINLAARTVYACEVAVHLITGLQYVRDNHPDNVPRLTAKFRKNIHYLRNAFPEYQHNFMLWSPIVKGTKNGSKFNQKNDIEAIVNTIHSELAETIDAVINEKFESAIADLRKIARNETKELDSSVMRFLQIEERLAMHNKKSRL
jgi:uncharacterized protein YlzI (FlbEa/FlbD family)